LRGQFEAGKEMGKGRKGGEREKKESDRRSVRKSPLPKYILVTALMSTV